MPRFKYAARDTFSKKTTGFLYAEDENALADKLAHAGYVLIYAIEEDIKRQKVVRLSLRKVLNLTMNLSFLVRGGSRLLDSLRTLAEDTEDRKLASLVSALADYIEAGGSFKNAVGLYPDTFSKIYVSMVDAGEKTGKLYVTLEDLVNYLEWQLDLRAKIRELAAYPTIIFAVMVLVVGVLVIGVIPKFEVIFSDLRIELPMATQIVLNVSHFASRSWHILSVVFFLLGVGVKFALRKDIIRLYYDKWKLRLPVLGKLIYDICMARFSRTMALSLANGIVIIESLELGQEAVGNKVLSNTVLEIKESVVTGGQLYDAFLLSKAFPNFLTRMVQVGERSGNLSDGFKKVCEFYDKEIPRKIKAIFTLLEPALIVSMGLIVGGIAISVFMPLIKMTQEVGGV